MSCSVFTENILLLSNIILDDTYYYITFQYSCEALVNKVLFLFLKVHRFPDKRSRINTFNYF